ncbi:MAG TPA: Arm DNA-binding domain-containing protein, partial [Puia sp.]|nr:Arm DNA-binding domain-containing protein [Puia sp.]
MASVKIVLRNEEKADGTYPLAIRVTKDRKSSFIYLDYSVKPVDWDKKERRVKTSHPSHARLNNYLIKELAKASDTTLELEGSSSSISAKAVTSKVKPTVAPTFFPQAQDYLDDLKKAGKYNP